MTTLENSTPNDGGRRDDPSQRNHKKSEPLHSKPTSPQADLSAEALPAHALDPRRVELEQRVHGVLRKMIDYLNIQVSAERYPSVEFLQNEFANPSHYAPDVNRIRMSAGDAQCGYIIGEEVAHWLQHTISKTSDKVKPSECALTDMQRSNAHEFLGYIGRKVAEQACKDSEYKELFSSKTKAPKSHQVLYEEHLEALKLIDSAFDKLEKLEKTLDAYSEFTEKVEIAVEELGTFLARTRPLTATQIDIWMVTVRAHLTKLFVLVNSFDPPSKIDEGIRGCLEQHRAELKQIHAQLKELWGTWRQQASTTNQIDQEKIHVEFRSVASKVDTAKLIIVPLQTARSLDHLSVTLEADSHLKHSEGYRSGAIWLEKNEYELSKARALFGKDLSELNWSFVTKLMTYREGSLLERLVFPLANSMKIIRSWF